MRKSKAEAAQTRENIVAAAAATFRRNGIAATGLVELMAAAGLTRGGFYKHFASKEQLVAEASAHAADELVAKMGAAMTAARRTSPLHGLLNAYLTPRHRDHPEQGCLFAALGPELAREGAPVRDAAAGGLARMLQLLEGGMTHDDAVVALSAAIGAMTVARLMPTEAGSKEVLRLVRTHLLEHVPSEDGDGNA